MSVEALAEIVAPAPGPSFDTGLVASVVDASHVEVDLGERTVTVFVPGTLAGAPGVGAFVRVSVQENTYVLDSVLSSPSASLVPVGCVLPYAGSAAPTGWLICDGSTFSSTTYPALYAVLGSTTLPDMRDRVVIGKSGTKGLNSTGGAADVTLARANVPPHYHATGFTGATIKEPASGTNVTVATTATPGNNTQTDTGSPTSFSVLNPYRALNFIVRAA